MSTNGPPVSPAQLFLPILSPPVQISEDTGQIFKISQGSQLEYASSHVLESNIGTAVFFIWSKKGNLGCFSA